MNKVIIMGRLTKEPEIRETASNIMVASFTLAVDRRTGKQGEKQADFFNCVAWRQTAEFMRNYIHKGTRIAVSGRLQNRNWDDAEGKKHYATEIVADEVFFADSKQEGAGAGRPFVPTGNNANSNPNNNANANADPFGNSSNGNTGSVSQQNAGDEGFYPVEDDDLPF